MRENVRKNEEKKPASRRKEGATMKMGRSARRGTAGVIAAVIMFGILFTVGTGYFIFVNSTNNQYVKNLVAASGNQQSAPYEVNTISNFSSTEPPHEPCGCP